MGVQLNQLRKSLMYGVNVGCTGGCLGERLNGIQAVSGSIPLISTIKIAGRTQSYEIIVLWHGFWLALDLTAQV